MPYLEPRHRERWDRYLTPLLNQIHFGTTSLGDLNYIITRILLKRLARNLSYTALCGVMGTLVCVGLELYRRVAAPYEDKKCAENGEVYDV
jgi:hypothetical protein